MRSWVAYGSDQTVSLYQHWMQTDGVGDRQRKSGVEMTIDQVQMERLKSFHRGAAVIMPYE